MAAFPSYAQIKLAGASVEHAAVVERTDMERGVPRVRRAQSDALVTLTGTILLRTRDDVAAFEAWYYSRLGGNAGAAWVDWTDPRTGTARSVRIATLGALVPLMGRFARAEWACTLEYMRSAY